RKAAFRAGRVTGTQWNDANIGYYSTAMGYDTIAFGSYSTAMGYNTLAGGSYSTAMGRNTRAIGHYSTAMGYGIEVQGNYSVAIALNDQTGTVVSQSNTMSIMGGNVGIGTTDPRTRLELGDDGAILAIGTYNSGWTEPDLGSGTRLLWYPRKAAFRAGRVTGTQWNDANIGSYSTAMGYNTTASGRSSTAIGYGTTASGWYSTAMGLETTASGWYSTAMGVRTTASGFYSTAMGRGIRAEGEYSVAIALNDQTGTAVSQHNTMSIMGGNVGIGTTDPGTNRLKVDGNTEITGNLNVGGTSTLKPPYAVQNSSSSWSVPESAPAARVYHPDPHATTNITIPTGTSMRLIIFVSGRIAYNAHTWGDYYVDVDNNSALVPACFRGHENVSTSGYQTDFSAICMTNTLGSGSHTIRVKWFDSNTRAGIATITHRNITVMAILP
ncbi:MAG: hypothetical protein QMD21_07475, partial [Candidatus Thermoplasmatota archaeon]|nr:hypothetical protein [Candidatus Thermoplasmatota archaeon]